MQRAFLVTLLLSVLVGCGLPPDSDRDGEPNATDNCVLDFNPAQWDEDADGVGDFCDFDESFVLEVTPADLEGRRYRLTVHPQRGELLFGVAVSVESYVPVSLESDHTTESIAYSRGLFPPHSQTFTVLGTWWSDIEWDFLFVEDDLDADAPIMLGVLEYEHPQPPPEVTFAGGSNAPGFEEGAVRFDESVTGESAGLVAGGNGSGGDSDGDNLSDNSDNCPTIYNPSQRNADGDYRGDVCDWAACDPDVTINPETGAEPETP